MDTKNWLEEKYQKIEEYTENFSISKYNLLKISFLKRLMEESLVHANSCKECSDHLPQLEKLVEEIPFLDDIEHRQPYEEKFNAVRKHFHQKHQFIPPYYFSTRWTIGGVVAGSLIAIGISVLFIGTIQLDPILAGSAVGLIIGYVIGSTRETKYRKTKRII